MRLLLLIWLGVSTLFGAEVVEIDDKYQKSQNCKACHLRIVKEWEESWHSKSHFEKDEYFQKSVEYVSRKTRKSLNGVKVECATCHNPRISVTSTDEHYEIAAVLGLDEDSKVNKAVNSDAISEGINCVVCHNIDKIHDELDESKRGIDRVSWTPSGLMTGPFKDAKSPYHKTVHHDFMDKNPNQLCFVCHANDRSVSGFVFTDMKSEYSDDTKTCVECHMGPRVEDVASTYKMDGKKKIRKVRHHGFAGAHSSAMWRDALNLELSHTKKDLLITIHNPLPHNVPSGFGARELIVEVAFKRGMKTLEERSISLTNSYTSKRGKATIPHLAVSQSKDMSIPAEGKKQLKTSLVSETTSVEVRIYYRLVNDEIRELLELEGENWSQKHFINQQSLKIN